MARYELVRTPEESAAQMMAEHAAMPDRGARSVHALDRKYRRRLASESPDYVLAMAHELREVHGAWYYPCSLLTAHRATLESVTVADIEAFGVGMNSWGKVDSYARALVGPAWLCGRLTDEDIVGWAHSADLWWRRAALVATVALNTRSKGGLGDTARTLAVCRLLVDDHEDMVEKGLSWALRMLVWHDPAAVREFLAEHDGVLGARVKREVRNKLVTGLKSPRKRPQ